MATVTETINIGETTNMHYYDPKDNEYVSLVPKQLYPVHAKKVDIRIVDVKGKYKAKVYNIIYEIAGVIITKNLISVIEERYKQLGGYLPISEKDILAKKDNKWVLI